VPLSKAMQIRRQRQQQRGWKLHSWHAPETECIGKGKAYKPWEFGCKVSIATTNRRCKGGQFVVHARAFHGNPYDGHTLRRVIEETQALTGRAVDPLDVDKGYRRHPAPKPQRRNQSERPLRPDRGERQAARVLYRGKACRTGACGNT